jgi:predicted acetyltransferase
MQLIDPSEQWESAFVAMARESAAAGEVRYALALTDFAAYLRKLDESRRLEDVARGHVPQLMFWLVDGDAIVATLRLRTRLTPALTDEGGHIGYDVRPSRRRRGYGTRLLQLGLEEARTRGINPIRITCDADNLGSIAIIERNGGVLSDERLSTNSGKQVRRYWIELDSLRVV